MLVLDGVFLQGKKRGLRTRFEYGPKNPVAGAGFGIRFSRRLYAMAEYEFYFHNCPDEFEPFEQAHQLVLV